MGKKQHWSWVLGELWALLIKQVSLALDPEVLVGVQLCSPSLFHEISCRASWRGDLEPRLLIWGWWEMEPCG